MTKAVVDIETDSLNATKIHCIVAKHYYSNQERCWIGDECKDFANWSKGISEFVMHNGISFDAPVLNRLTGSNIKLNQIRDTLIESQLYNPIRDGGHSLESWGERLNYNKGNFTEFSEYSDNMLEYCKRDVELTRRLSVKLQEEGKNFSSQAYEIERKVRSIVDKQQQNGFALNIKEAMLLQAELLDEQYNLERQADETFPPKEIQLKTKVKYVPFNIASRKQIAERLIEKGWKPDKHTDKGNIIVSEEVLSKIKDIPEAEMFSRYFLLQKRTGLLKSWIQECQEDERVRGKVLTLRTVTGRMAHHGPNMAQVPAIYSPYGKECRSLWTVSNTDTHSLVGTDASGLEIRCLAHYMDNAKFTDIVLSGDVHTANQQAAGLKTRDQAKTFIYAFLYGAGAAKIGKIVGGDADVGQRLISKFLSNMSALKVLRENIQERIKDHDTIRGLDGRMLYIRSPHAALNTLIQGAGAIICKQWLIQMDNRINQLGIDAKLVASVHDEYQFEVLKSDVKRFTKITKESMWDTQRIFNFKCDLDCDYKIGKTWAETH
jgi:DNA polymerase-1|tara:strand:- start:3334 stop:4974 length:1641 start_codon:yes stop_codon:yes gene_type:complete